MRPCQKTRLAIMFLIAGLLLSACAPGSSTWTAAGSSDSCLDVIGPRPAPVSGVYVQPDDGYAPVLDEIAAARCTLDLNMYMLTDDMVFDALFAAQGRGVTVRVILEQHPFGMFGDQQEAFDRLREAGIGVQWDREGLQFSHAKFLVVDRHTAVITNQNFTGSAFNSNREFGVITTVPDEVNHAQAVFDADWSGAVAADITGPLLASPDNARERLLDFIAGAQKSIAFYAELIRDVEVMAALEGAVERGVQVRLIMNASLDPADIESVRALVDHGVEVRLMASIYIHSKTMIVDGEAALIGSINYSMTSLDRNRELAVIVEDPLLMRRVNAVYERDWVRSVPVEPGS